jgi:hypothetical protein
MKAKKLVLIDDSMRSVPKKEKEPTTLWGRPWTHGADVMTTWKKHGFRPPTEYRNDYRFKINREAGDDH